MNHPVAATAVKSPLQALLDSLDRLTGQRQRPRLEETLIAALLELAGADRIAYYKIQALRDDPLYWLAVEADAAGIRVIDDGINLPDTLLPLAERPDLAALATATVSTVVDEPGGACLLQPVPGPGSAHGFIAMHLREPPDAARRAMVAGLVTVFRNVMALLDYSETDSLTGLLNRKTFDEHLMHILAALQAADSRTGGTMPQRRGPAHEGDSHWLGVLDIDHFKRINDNFGHLIGDEVLLMVANLMRGNFRFRDKLFRFGGEEFVVVLKPTGAEQAAATFGRFRCAMEQHLFPQVGKVTISIGFAPIRLHDQPSLVLDRADQALYWSKEHGRNRVSSYEALVASGELAHSPEMHTDVELF